MSPWCPSSQQSSCHPVSHRQAHQLSALSSLLFFSVSYPGHKHGPQLGSFPLAIVSFLIFKPLASHHFQQSLFRDLPACPRTGSAPQVFLYQPPCFSVLGSVALSPQLCSPSLSVWAPSLCLLWHCGFQHPVQWCQMWFLHAGTNCPFCYVFSVHNYSLFFGARISKFCIYCLLRLIPIQELFSLCRSHNFSFLTNTAVFH